MSEAPPSNGTAGSAPSRAGAGGAGEVERTRAVLARMGAPETLAEPLVAALGAEADPAAQLADDPWRLLVLRRVTVEQADYCARQVIGADISPDDPRRGRAVVEHLLRRAAGDGHTAIEERRLVRAARSMGVRSTDAALAAAVDGGEVVVSEVIEEPDDDPTESEEVPEMPEPDRYYALARLGRVEGRLGAGIARLVGTSEPIMDSATAAETVTATAKRLGLEVAPETTAALVTLALRGVCVLEHSAAAAPALTHALACAADIAAESELPITVTAPTAQAAAALNSDLDAIGAGEVRAVPVARLLECSAPGVFGRGPDHPVEAGLVVVCEAMALDLEHAAALVDACADGTSLVLVADPAEAPSAAPGQVLADVVASRTVTVARLPDSAAPGPVAGLAGMVAGGELGQVEAPGREVVVIPAGSAGEAAHRAVQLITDSIPRALEIPVESVQIVAATRGGEAGTDALNSACKARLNPGPGAYNGLDAGDRVLLGADGPGYAAGDVGYLRGDPESGLGVELADGSIAAVPDPALLRPGWAITVAAAHGGRWPAVVAVFPPETRGSRPQVYTAVTRALRHLSVVHAAGPALAQAVRDTATLPRHTRLPHILRES